MLLYVICSHDRQGKYIGWSIKVTCHGIAIDLFVFIDMHALDKQLEQLETTRKYRIIFSHDFRAI